MQPTASNVNPKRGGFIATPDASSTLMDALIQQQVIEENRSAEEIEGIQSTSGQEESAMEITPIEGSQGDVTDRPAPATEAAQPVQLVPFVPDVNSKRRAANLLKFLKQMCSEDANTNFSSREWAV